MLRRPLLIAIASFLTTSGVLYPFLARSQSQARSSRVTEEDGILGFALQRGLSGLQRLLQASKPTQFSNIRQIVVPVPQTGSDTPTPLSQFYLEKLPGIAAIDTFHQITEPESSPPTDQIDLEVEGETRKLQGGGILRLKVNSDKSPVTATIEVLGVKVPGYEAVRQINFVLPQNST